MAIIKCPECGHQTSDKAPVCPSCGVEIAGKITKCPYCGEIYFKNEVVCPHCHKAVEYDIEKEDTSQIQENINDTATSKELTVSQTNTQTGKCYAKNDGDLWELACEEKLSQGDNVKVFKVDGIKLFVKKENK